MTILLDLDGPLIPLTSWKQPDILDDNFPNFKQEAVDAINHIIKETNANILLTSSHKDNPFLDWVSIFNKRGINITEIDKLPTNRLRFTRKIELQEFLKNNLDNYVIIDDDRTLNSLPENIKCNWVMVSPLIGLTMEGALDAIKILTN